MTAILFGYKRPVTFSVSCPKTTHCHESGGSDRFGHRLVQEVMQMNHPSLFQKLIDSAWSIERRMPDAGREDVDWAAWGRGTEGDFGGHCKYLGDQNGSRFLSLYGFEWLIPWIYRT